MTKKSKLALVAAVLAALICGSPVLAATTTYADNRAGFLAATGATTIGALPGLTSPTNVDGVTVGPITYKEVAGSNAVFFDYSNEISGSEIGISGVENFNMRVAAGVYSIGFAIHEPTYQGSNNYRSHVVNRFHWQASRPHQ